MKVAAYGKCGIVTARNSLPFRHTDGWLRFGQQPTHMALPGNSSLPLIFFYPGNPTNVSTSIINPPLGSIVIDYTTPALWQKTTAMGDNSGYNGASGGTINAPLITNGLTASGSASNDFSGSTGTFKTSTGVNTIGGAMVFAANKGVTVSAGTSAFDFSGGTGVTKTTTGLFTVSGGMAGSVQALSGAGAVNLTTTSTVVTSTGANALTLADGTNGQIKTIVMAVDGGDATLTPSTKTGYTTIVFNDIGDGVTLQFFTTIGWIVVGSFGVTIS